MTINFKSLEVMKMEVRYASDNYAMYIGLVKVIFDNNVTNFSAQEAQRYVDFVQSKVKTPLKKIFVTQCPDGKVKIDYVAEGEKFERLRRITGYLTADVRNWNNAKQAEERDRVKHI